MAFSSIMIQGKALELGTYDRAFHVWLSFGILAVQKFLAKNI
jgi:hypothetical protein